ncbi:hypothetical protein Tco_0609063, partial [Tanacetum coccineum]
MQVLNTIVEENMEEKEKDKDHSLDILTIAKDAEVTLMRSRPMDMDAQTADYDHDVSHSEHTSWEKTASTEFQNLISHSLKAQLLGLLSDTLKNCLPQLLKESLTPLIPSVFESVVEEQAQLN